MQQKKITKEWVVENSALLRERLPKDIQLAPFFPDTQFYAQYIPDHRMGLRLMAARLFSLLNITPNGCVVDFYNEKDMSNLGAHTAGFYTRIKDDHNIEKEVIFINSKHQDDPLAVGAVLAHEMMHLYLFRLNLKIDNTQENELLTDLATIQAGFSILVLNGMSYSTQWYLTIIFLMFGRIYWRSEQMAFGYFKPNEYARHALDYFNGKGLTTEDIIGYINPASRHFIPNSLFTKGKTTTEFIRSLEKRRQKSTTIQGLIVVIFIVLAFWVLSNDSASTTTQSDPVVGQIESCKASVPDLESRALADQTVVKNLSARLSEYEQANDVENYNALVDPYNKALAMFKSDIADYENLRTRCNDLIDQYNNQHSN